MGTPRAEAIHFTVVRRPDSAVIVESKVPECLASCVGDPRWQGLVRESIAPQH